MNTWRLYTYDLWGNEEDGWEVNDVFQKSTTLELSAEPTDAEVSEALASACECSTENVDVDQADEDTIYLTDDRTGKPLAELRRETA
jgi:hypothetical protein